MKVARLVFLLALLPVAALAWPFGSLPQCGPYPTCGSGCYVPPSPKCAQVAQDMLDAGTASPCDDGGGPGICI